MMTDQEAKILDQGLDWLLSFGETVLDSVGPYRDLTERNVAFLEWLETSETHVRIFSQLMDVERRITVLNRRGKSNGGGHEI
jgi:hypothetical protein